MLEIVVVGIFVVVRGVAAAYDYRAPAAVGNGAGGGAQYATAAVAIGDIR